jgi:hypothetical protein
MPSGGTMKHENRGADFSPEGTYPRRGPMGGLVCWQAGKPAPHCLFSEE